MARKNNSSTTTFRRTVVILASFVLVAGFVLFVLEKSQITDYYEKPKPMIEGVLPNIQSVYKIDYSPATTTETDEANRIKESVQNQQGSPATINGLIDVSLSAAGQDAKGGPIIVRAIIGSNSGQCKLTITNSTLSKELTADVENMGTYYSCKGFDVPIADIPAGSYQATLTVTNGSAIGSVTQQLEVTR